MGARARLAAPTLLGPVLLLAGVGAAALFGLSAPAPATAAAPTPTTPAPAGTPPTTGAGLFSRGQVLYTLYCQTCHQADGAGQSALGIPTLHGVGAAAVDFYVSTGRMPEATIEAQAPRKPVSIDPADRSALVAFITTKWPGGPDIPTFNLNGNLQNGGDLFRTNCAACHGAVGAGAALANGAYAPTLHKATARQVAEAMRVGPGNMPVFQPATLSDSAVADIVTYVQYLHHPDDRGGAGLGYTGPIAEGFVGLLIGLGGAVGIATWAGHRTDDEPVPHA